MAALARPLSVVTPAEPTSAALRALSLGERQTCWHLFGLLVDILRRAPERMKYIESAIATCAEDIPPARPKS